MLPKRLYVACCVFWVFLTCVSFVLADDPNIQIVPYLATEEREFFGTPNLNTVYYFTPAISLNYKSGKVVISGNPDGTGDIDVGEELRVTSSPGNTIFTYQNCPQKRMPPLDITHLMWMGHYENITNVTLAFIGRNCFDTSKQNGQTVAYSNISKIYLVHFKNPDTGLPFPFLSLPWSLTGKNLSFVEALMNERSGFSTFPKLKYSWDSSSGLTHDTSVLASAGGTATFDNSCLLCGNSIYIDHGNKFQTRYHHLQTSGLFVNSLAPKKTVIQGQEIGRVQAGSTGAVLDFEVIKDVNGDGNFNDNLIDGLVDPTGWNSISSIPWKTYDGGPRKSLWQSGPTYSKKTIGANGGNFSFARGSINIQKNLLIKDHLISLEPIYPTKFDSLSSIGSGVRVKIDDGFGNMVTKFNQKFQIVFTLFGINTARFNQSNFGIYSREEGAQWTKEVTTIDLSKNQASINIDHLTDFALMGRMLDQNPPFTKARVINSKLNFEVSDLPIGNSLGIEKTMFRLDEIPVGTRLGTDGGAWVLYSSPVSLVQNKKYILEFFSVDKDGNTENVKGISIFGDYDPDKIPVLFIPGFGGSELVTGDEISWSMPDGHGGTYSHFYPKGEVIWVNSLQAILPGNDDYFDVMRLRDDGVTGEANLTLSGRMFDAYQGAISFFESNGYTLDQDLFYFPYDWRKDVSLTGGLLDQKIESIKAKTGVAQVNIVAHSMGGLVARNYILDGSRASKVKKLITLGTPHLGAVEMLKNLMYGSCLTRDGLFNQLGEIGVCLGLTKFEVRELMQNMSSSFNVLPSKKFFEFYDGSNSDHPLPFVDSRDIDNDGTVGQLDYLKLKRLLSNLKHNTALYSFGENFHLSDNFLDNPNGVDVSIIVGSGIPTLGQIIEDYAFDFAGIKIPKTDMRYVNGDKTVTLYSASLRDGNKNLSGNSKIYFTKQKHGEIFGIGPGMDMVKNILKGNAVLPNGVSSSPYKFSGTGMSVHSPVNIHVYDSQNRHTGLTTDGDVELGIPDSSYEEVGEAKFVFLPDGGVYTVKFVPTGEGSFDFKIRDFKDDVNSQTVLYKDIPLTTKTLAKATVDTSSTQNPVLAVDSDGNGSTDKQVVATAILKGEAGYTQLTPSPTPTVSPTSSTTQTSASSSSPTTSPNSSSSTSSQGSSNSTNSNPISKYLSSAIKNNEVEELKSQSSNKDDVLGVESSIHNSKALNLKNRVDNKSLILGIFAILISGSIILVFYRKFFG